MKRLPSPNVDPVVAYTACVSSISDANLNHLFSQKSALMGALAKHYQRRAVAGSLHFYRPCKWANPEQTVLNTLTKQQFVGLYSNISKQKASHPARIFYDQIRSSELICPYCRFGHVSTLDHFLPKAYYPYFSVLPTNLVPSCADCNTSKSSSVLNASNSIPHPYYAAKNIESDQWLYATIISGTPLGVNFSVSPPSSWSNQQKHQIHNYFSSFKLDRRLATQASAELSDFIDSISTQNLNKESTLFLIKSNLATDRKNYWKTALYQALLLHFSDSKPCPVCNGEGKFISTPCPECKGSAKILLPCPSDEELIASNINVDCILCDRLNNAGCQACGGRNMISREKALQLHKDHSSI